MRSDRQAKESLVADGEVFKQLEGATKQLLKALKELRASNLKSSDRQKQKELIKVHLEKGDY